MKFTKIVLYTIKEFNKNKEKDGCLPHEGEVISIAPNNGLTNNYVAVGFK
ncbi:hypothetical protein Q2T76_02215 [Lactobacillus sp. YT155]|nr:hypothetical protein [Lactobacillus sp. YT155]MDO1604865.1 hypothetical protein [Lactobacillus sp. YT155]